MQGICGSTPTKCKITHLGKKNSVNASVMGDSVLQRVNVFLFVGRQYCLQKKGITFPSYLIWPLVNTRVSADVCNSRDFREELGNLLKNCLKGNVKGDLLILFIKQKVRREPIEHVQAPTWGKKTITEVPN